MRIYLVFHVSLLEPAATDPLVGQREIERPPIEVDGDDEYEVEEIFDSRRRNKTIQYLVKWLGYPDPN